MTNLRDELWTMLEPHFAIMGVAFPEKPIDRNAHIEKWAQFIGRALAAERAATIEECKRAAQAAPTFSNDLIGRGKSYAVKRIDESPRNRSALDEVVAQARREQREKDASKLERMAGEWAEVNGIRDWPMIKEIAAAIRAQED